MLYKQKFIVKVRIAKVNISIFVMKETSDQLRSSTPVPLRPRQDPPTLHNGHRLKGKRCRHTEKNGDCPFLVIILQKSGIVPF